MVTTVAAVDLGATSGRVILGHVSTDEIRLEHVARFANQPVRTRDGLHWNILELYRNVTAGLAAASELAPGLASIGVDSWAVDYALMRGGRMLGTPYHYRDDRTEKSVDAVHDVVAAEELYAVSGLQHLPFNTVFQLEADRAAGLLGLADRLLLIPDLLGYWLTGEEVAERTNASTTGLLDASSGEWSADLLSRLDVSPGILPPLVSPGERVGVTSRGLDASGLRPGVPVTAVGSHDTASAVVAVPATEPDFAYISCGTWSLVGVELDAPLITAAGRAANFTNEGGVDGRTRYLHNVMGLWLLTETLKQWRATDDLERLLAEAAGLGAGSVDLFDPNDPRFLAPGDMPARITGLLEESGARIPPTRAGLVRSILESLAKAYAETIDEVGRLTGRPVRVVHLVGGGSQNELLCQLTADCCGLPVLAGPVEATAIGNVLVQARAISGGSQSLESHSLEALRALVAATFQPRSYHPRALLRAS